MFDRGDLGLAAGGGGDGRSGRPTIRCAIYTRKSSEEGLEQDFNSLHAQRDACEAYILSQRHEGWSALPTLYDDGGFSGGSLQRPAVRRLMADIEAGLIDCVVVYKVDRLTRSLSDFARMVEVFDAKRVSFVSVTQAFNTTNSMGRLTLNVLLSFAQFEREVTGERIRDKIAASKKKGMWMGGWVPIGYDAADRTLTIKQPEAEVVRTIFRLYLDLGNVRLVQEELHRRRLVTKRYVAANGRTTGGGPFSRGHFYKILGNPIYRGQIVHKGITHRGQHEAIIDRETWEGTQALLTTNGHVRRVGQNAKVPSLLSGLLVDEHGEPMKPVHANKEGRRYRYYAARAVGQGGRSRRAGDSAALARARGGADFTDNAVLPGDNRPPPFRLAAAEIEPLIIQELTAILRDEQRLAGWVGEGASIDEVWQALNQARRQAGVFETGTPSEQREALLSSVQQIQVERHALWITLNRSALVGPEHEKNDRGEADQGEGTETEPLSNLRGSRAIAERARRPGEDGRPAFAGDDIVLHLPVSLARRGNEIKLVLTHGAAVRSSDTPDRALIKAVARAYAWWDELSSGRAASIQAIAERESVTDRYVSQVINLAFLAPPIAEAILGGTHTSPPTAKALILGEDVPLVWAEQRPMMQIKGAR